MKPQVIDASVAIKWFLPEPGSDQALEVLDTLEHALVPDLFYIESDSILSRKIRKRELSISEAEFLYDEFRNLPFITINYDRISTSALKLATEFSITQYDACYLAVAVEFDGKLYTADQRLYNRLSSTVFGDFVMNIYQL